MVADMAKKVSVNKQRTVVQSQSKKSSQQRSNSVEQEPIKKESDANKVGQGKRRTPAAPTAPRKQTKMMASIANALTKQVTMSSMSPDIVPKKQ